jgi:aminomethyltransferase
MKHLPLHDVFLQNGAKLISFGDWEVPAYFSSIIDEHITVRTAAGIFDISHMGIFAVYGKDAQQFLRYMCTNDLSSVGDGKAIYSTVCNSEGGIIDDIFIYKKNPHDFLIIVNAANSVKDFDWFSQHRAPFDCQIEDRSPDLGLFAIQGPASGFILKKAFGFDLGDYAFHSFQQIQTGGIDVLVATTGYTGEWGCEIVFPRTQATFLWNTLYDAGVPFGLKPIGFGARDTLRLEAGCLLYGKDMDETITPFEAGIGWTVKIGPEDFIGKNALVKQKKEGLLKKIIGFELLDKGIARHGAMMRKDGKSIGTVTSGSYCPSVDKTIGFGYIDSEYALVGEDLFIEVRNRLLKARIVQRPFYRRVAKDVSALSKTV